VTTAPDGKPGDKMAKRASVLKSTIEFDFWLVFLQKKSFRETSAKRFFPASPVQSGLCEDPFSRKTGKKYQSEA